MKLKILLVDNVPEFLEIQARLLEQEGYFVLTASSTTKAEELMELIWFQLVIIDLRMEDEEDPADISGLIFAQKTVSEYTPKIILTAYPDYASAVTALSTAEGTPLAIDYVAKQKGPKALSNAVKSAITKFVNVNWDLNIQTNKSFPITFLHLASLLNPELENQFLINRAEELEGLIRMSFFEKDQIRIDRILWYHKQRIAFVVLDFKAGMLMDEFVVVCGQSVQIKLERDLYKKFSPKSGGDTGIIWSMNKETTHYGVNIYVLPNVNLEKVFSLFSLYQTGPEKLFNEALESLFHKSLNAWHLGKQAIGRKTINEIYCQRLELTKEYFIHANFKERIKVIENQIAILGPKIEYANKTLIFHFSGQSFSYLDPLPILYKVFDQKEPGLIINVPGTLTGKNILTDDSGQTWLTDFVEAGLAPLFWNFVALEAAIRLDWVETNDLLRCQELEHCLINTDFAKPDTRDLESVVSKPARAIKVIRKLAAHVVGKNVHDYHLGIFFHAARRLADFDPTLPLTSSELARLGHILLSMAMIAEKLEQGNANEQPMKLIGSDQLRIVDEKARIVRIANRKERLTPQTFEILWYLYNHANEVCTKEELKDGPLKGKKYDEGYLHTLIGRIRKVIEDDPEHPRFLITEPNSGYRLIPKPEKMN